jgi:ribosomal protein S27E
MPITTNLTDLTSARARLMKRINLPSGGAAAPRSFPDGELTIYPWDSTIDDVIFQRDALRNKRGNGSSTQDPALFFDLLPSLCNLNGCPIERFFASEVMLVVMVSRALSRNNVVSINVKCPECGKMNNVSVTVPDDLEILGQKQPGYLGYDDIVLPSAKDVVRMRPLTVGDELSIIREDEGDDIPLVLPKGALDPRKLGMRMRRAIHAVVAIGASADKLGAPDSAQEVVTYLAALPPTDLEFIYKQSNELSPQLSTRVRIKCEHCGHEYDAYLDLGRDFFR